MFAPGFLLTKDVPSEYEFYSWAGAQILAGADNDKERLRNAYLDQTIRTPEQLLLLAQPQIPKSRTPESTMKEKLDKRHALCLDRYIDRCIKSGKYKEYSSVWDQYNSRGTSYGTRFMDLCYSDVCIVTMDIVSSERFFGQSPGSSLASFFQVRLFPSTFYLLDGDGNVVDDGPMGGMWYWEYNVRPLDGNVEWSVNKFLSYRPRILPFGLQMNKKPAERPSAADFTVTVGYSDGTVCTSTISVEFPY